MKQELLGLVSELPAVYVKVTGLLDGVRPAIAYYKSFVEFSCSRWVGLNYLLLLVGVANFVGNQPMNCYPCCVTYVTMAMLHYISGRQGKSLRLEMLPVANVLCWRICVTTVVKYSYLVLHS